MFLPGDTVIHSKGGRYKIIDRCFIESTLTECYAYREISSSLIWIRPVLEMEDGRFKLCIK